MKKTAATPTPEPRPSRIQRTLSFVARHVEVLVTSTLGVIGVALVLTQIHADGRPWIVSSQNPILPRGTNYDAEGPFVLDLATSTQVVWLKNAGASPALNTRTRSCFRIGQQADDLPRCDEMQRPGRPVVGPDQVYWATLALDLNQAQVESLSKKRDTTLFILTEVDYDDGFLVPAFWMHRHRSTFCWFYSFDDGGWIACDGRNTAD